MSTTLQEFIDSSVRDFVDDAGPNGAVYGDIASNLEVQVSDREEFIQELVLYGLRRCIDASLAKLRRNDEAMSVEQGKWKSMESVNRKEIVNNLSRRTRSVGSHAMNIDKEIEKREDEHPDLLPDLPLDYQPYIVYAHEHRDILAERNRESDDEEGAPA